MSEGVGERGQWRGKGSASLLCCVELQYCLSHEVWEGYPENSSDDNAMSERVSE